MNKHKLFVMLFMIFLVSLQIVLADSPSDSASARAASEEGERIAVTKDVTDTYGSMRGTHLLDDWKWLQNWQSGVDSIFSGLFGVGLGIDAWKHNLCSVWTDTEDGPSSIVAGNNGLPSAHVEGEKQKAYIGNVTAIQTYIYKITLGINPSNMMANRDYALVVKLYVEPGRIPVYITEGTAGSEVIRLKGDSAEVIYAGDSMIVRASNSEYDSVCLDFTDSWEWLSGTVKDSLGSDKRICNSLTVNNDMSISNTYMSIGTVLTGDGGEGSGGSGDTGDSGSRAPEESVPETSNSGNVNTGGGSL